MQANLYGPRVLLVGGDEPDCAFDMTAVSSLTEVSGQSFNTVVLDDLDPADAKKQLGLAAMLLSHEGHIVARFLEDADIAIAYEIVYPLFQVASMTISDRRVSLAACLREEPLASVDTAQRSADFNQALQHALLDFSSETELLRDKLASANALQQETAVKLRARERDFRRRTIELLESAESRDDFRSERERLEQQLRHAGLQADKVKRTLSYQLGYELIHSTKSVKKLVSLPAALLSINQDAALRRKKRTGNASGLGALLDSARGYRKSMRAKIRPQSRKVAPTARTPIAAQAPDEIELGSQLSKLRVACIMDEFTLRSFESECELISLSAHSWKQQVQEAAPHLLLVESSWRGHLDEWQGKIAHLAPELRDLLTWCREEGKIPTAFWNKEDPVHFGTFLNTAAEFDFVFTTDFDCIHRYKELLGHERVYLLPFACQPALQNPIERFERKDAACFAGAYYLRYPERQRDFLRIVVRLLERGPVEIFDRNYGKTDGSYQFPDSYREFIVGSLPFSEIDRAYKGYRYGININSIKYSQSMFARRVFELLASNTVTVSNFSRGIQLMFGDLVVSTDDPDRLAAKLSSIDESETSMRRFRLSGLRKVLGEHTYEDRLAYLVGKVFGLSPARLLPEIVVVAAPRNEADAAGLIAAYQRQLYPHKRMLLITSSAVTSADRTIGVCSPDDSLVTDVVGNVDFVASFASEDYYGATYLGDLALNTRYFDGSAIGKLSQYRWSATGPQLVDADRQYRTAQSVAARASIVSPSVFGDMSASEFVQRGCSLQVANALSVDEFSYCYEGAGHEDDPRLAEVRAEVSGLDEGLSLTRILEEADQIGPPVICADTDTTAELGPEALEDLFAEGFTKSLVIEHGTDGMLIESTLGDDERQYLYEEGEHPLHGLGFSDKACFHLEVSAGLRIQSVFLFLDHTKQRVGHEINFAAMNHELEIPSGAVFARFGLLIVGPGLARVKRLVLGHLTSQEPTRILGRQETLLLTNSYPSGKDLYQNAFVHRRVLKYRETGIGIDVFCHRLHGSLGYHEFEGVEVTTGSTNSLRQVLATNRYKTVLVHFLDEHMWKALREQLEHTQVIIWLHGAEVQPWHRRAFNYSSPEEIEHAKAASERRTSFWRSIFRDMHPNLRVVFVSQSFATDVMNDYGITIPEAQHEVIHNLIDSDLFRYKTKTADHRLRILSIRPFASRAYANDLSVQAILELSSKPFFNELEFRLIGDGPLFEETVEPLRGFHNVLIEQRFLRQSEIAELHQDYGVFLCPTRMDSQGVSRDEAMASGLVPVTTKVAAVPEFVDESCGFLAPEEDASALAAAIETLYADPELFLKLSASAAARAQTQSGATQTIQRELSLFSVSESSFELPPKPCQVDCEKD